MFDIHWHWAYAHSPRYYIAGISNLLLAGFGGLMVLLSWWKRKQLERKRRKLCEEYGICPIHATPMTYWGNYRYQTHCDGCLRDSQEKHRLETERQVIQNRLDREASAIARSAAASVVANLNKKLG